MRDLLKLVDRLAAGDAFEQVDVLLDVGVYLVADAEPADPVAALELVDAPARG